MPTIAVTDASFQSDVLDSDKPVLVDFWAEWCGPCKMIGPALEEIADELGDKVTIAKMDIMENTGVPGQIGVQSIPLMVLFKDGKPVFYDEKGYSGLSQTALYFIGGVLKHVSAICAFSNPSTNSYKRLLPGFEAPVTIGYATANRSAVIRIPAYAKTPDKKRFELRNPDATCNPYYCYAAILMAGLDGIKNKIDPEAEGYGPYDFNLFNLSEEDKKKIKGLPKSLGSALKALEKDHDFLTAGGVFPIELINLWIANRRKDLGRHISMPTPMEYEMYYDL